MAPILARLANVLHHYIDSSNSDPIEKGARARMIIALVELLPSPGSKQSILEILRIAQRSARTKAACVGCDIYETVDTSHKILYLEQWRNVEALHRHIQSSVYLRVLNAMDLSAEPPTVVFHKVSDTKSMDLIESLRGGALHADTWK
jgi:quinol monooxygenase YgiN